jgi:hypothetical protein
VGLANETDALVLGPIARRTRFLDHTLVEVPARRDFYFGNLLVLDREPALEALPVWLARHAELFAGVPIERHTLVWERDRVGAAPIVGASVAGDLTRTIVFVRRVPFADALANDAIRPLETEAEWARAAELDALEHVPALGEFARWRFGVARESARTGRLRMWGFWNADDLVAFAGIYAAGGPARFETPVTHPSFRRRGALRALCAVAVNDALARDPNAPVVICAAAGEPPEAIYRKLGFDAVGEQVGLTCAVSKAGAHRLYS